jgi:uncharacterized repeat protein (TIGR03803 family)
MKTKSLSFIGTFLLFIGFLTTTQAQEFWGLTNTGGVNNTGIIFQWAVTTSGFFNTNFDFGDTSSGATHPGRSPQGSLVLASNGNLYGMTPQGGATNSGTLFEYNPVTFTFTKKVDFDNNTTGIAAVGALVQASNGVLYGMTKQGGTGDAGVFFQFNPSSSTFNKIFDFGSSGLGGNPQGSLIQASNGRLYGMTSTTIFEYDINTGTKTALKVLNGTTFTDGTTLDGSLIQASNGKLYGMAERGGVGFGTLFEYDLTTSTFTKLMDFGNGKGQFPMGSLIQATNSKLYGLTWLGGANNLGVLFEYDITTNTYTKKIDFDGADHGSEPKGSLLEASSGKFYGATSTGGLNGLGTLFEFDLVTNILIKKLDMGSFGTGTVVTGNTMLGNLVERSTSILGVSEIEKQFEFSLYPNPTSTVVKMQYNSNLNISKIRLFNSIGSLVKEFKASQTELNISKLPTGLYILKVATDKGNISKKIIKD